MTVVAWDPTHCAAGLTLSGSDLHVTNNNGGNNGVLATGGQSTGKFYHETSIILGDDPHYNTIGVALTSSSTAALYAGTGGIGVAARGEIYSGGNDQATNIFGAVLMDGHVLCHATDVGALLYWARVDNGLWNNNALADPDTGVGGMPITTGAGTYTPFCSSSSGGAGLFENVSNFGGSAFAFTKPSTFSAWGSASAPVPNPQPVIVIMQ